MGRKPRSMGAMHVVTNRRQGVRREYVTHLLRRSFREGGKVRNETLANLSHLPDEVIELVRGALRGERFVPVGEGFRVERSLPAGHVNAALCLARRLDLARLLDRGPSRERDLALAMIVCRLLEPGSKLSTVRALERSTLASELAIEGLDEDDLYRALDWLGERQQRIEAGLARRHLRDGELVLYDLSSSFFEGRSCPLASLGYSRDQKRGTLQVTYGLLCTRAGVPVAVEAFDGKAHDDETVCAQIDKLRRRFGLERVVLVADRGMVTKANLDALKEAGYGWITALKAPQLKRLVKTGALQLSLFDEHNLAEVASDDYPGERLVVCRNPLVGADRARKREQLLQATERELSQIERRVDQGTLRGAAEIGLQVGPALKRYRVKKHFLVEITDRSFEFRRNQPRIDQEAALDGVYALRTTVAEAELDAGDVVRSYKQLKEVERGFRTLKGPELEIRPIHHRLESRVRAHIFLCTLAYYLEWHLRQAWRELTYQDEQPPPQPDPVAKARRSASAEQKARTKTTSRDEPAHSFGSLLAELATQTRNTIRLPGTDATFQKLTDPTPLQARALELASR